MADLFTPAKLGAITLPNRILMAPLTRSRTGHAGVPGPMNATYYAQRATAGAIIAEATQISPQGQGYAYTPGIYNEAQVAGWKLVTEAVHRAGGRIFLQLWHVGRISHPSLQPDGGLPVAPSAIRPEGKAFTEAGFQPFVTPRALETDEIAGIVEDYRRAAVNADKAGFDGVEIHGANGYLIDQFLKDGTNQRSDRYGGSIENRTRFLLEVTEAVVGVLGGDRVGLRISPVSPGERHRGQRPAAAVRPCRRRAGAASTSPSCMWSRARPAAHARQRLRLPGAAPGLQGRLCRQQRLRPPDWPRRRRRRPRRCRRLRPALHRQPGPGRAAPHQGAAGRAGPRHALWRRRQGLYRLPGADPRRGLTLAFRGRRAYRIIVLALAGPDIRPIALKFENFHL